MILDKVVVDGVERFGVIDHYTTKHVIFYDRDSYDIDSELKKFTMAVILWRTHTPTMRFSVFVNTFLPDTKVKAPISVSKKSIHNDIKIPQYSKPKPTVLRVINK